MSEVPLHKRTPPPRTIVCLSGSLWWVKGCRRCLPCKMPLYYKSNSQKSTCSCEAVRSKSGMCNLVLEEPLYYILHEHDVQGYLAHERPPHPPRTPIGP